MARPSQAEPTIGRASDAAPDGVDAADIDVDLAARRQALASRIDKVATQHAPKPDRQQSDMSGIGLGLKIGSEFVAGVLVGAGLGYLIDQLAGTTPWGLIVFLMLGFAAGVLNVMRATGRVAEPRPHGLRDRANVREEEKPTDR